MDRGWGHKAASQHSARCGKLTVVVCTGSRRTTLERAYCISLTQGLVWTSSQTTRGAIFLQQSLCYWRMLHGTRSLGEPQVAVQDQGRMSRDISARVFSLACSLRRFDRAGATECSQSTWSLQSKGQKLGSSMEQLRMLVPPAGHYECGSIGHLCVQRLIEKGVKKGARPDVASCQRVTDKQYGKHIEMTLHLVTKPSAEPTAGAKSPFRVTLDHTNNGGSARGAVVRLRGSSPRLLRCRLCTERSISHSMSPIAWTKGNGRTDSAGICPVHA